MVAVIKEICEQAPGTGAYKLFLMLKSTFADKMAGRDKFYNEERLHYSNGMLTPKAMREKHSLEASRLQP